MKLNPELAKYIIGLAVSAAASYGAVQASLATLNANVTNTMQRVDRLELRIYK